MRISYVIVVATLVVGLASTEAQSVVQTQRLVATTIPLGASPTASVLSAIWQDRLVAEREKLGSLAKLTSNSPPPSPEAPVNAFIASFNDGDKTIIVSALFTSPECANFSGAASPNLNNCPMRVAVLQNGQIKIVAAVSDFPFVAALKNVANDKGNEFDNQTPRNKTLVMFDARTHEITTALTLNGVLDNEKSTPLRIAY